MTRLASIMHSLIYTLVYPSYIQSHPTQCAMPCSLLLLSPQRCERLFNKRLLPWSSRTQQRQEPPLARLVLHLLSSLPENSLAPTLRRSDATLISSLRRLPSSSNNSTSHRRTQQTTLMRNTQNDPLAFRLGVKVI